MPGAQFWAGLGHHVQTQLEPAHRDDTYPGTGGENGGIWAESTIWDFFYIYKFIYFLFIYFWLYWVFVAARRLSLAAASGGYSLLQCVGFSLRWLLLWSTGSRHGGFSSCAHGLSSCGLRALECKLSSCGARASLLRSMWDLARPGLKPMSPALAGGFLTTVPQGKSYHLGFNGLPYCLIEEPSASPNPYLIFLA